MERTRRKIGNGLLNRTSPSLQDRKHHHYPNLSTRRLFLSKTTSVTPGKWKQNDKKEQDREKDQVPRVQIGLSLQSNMHEIYV
jgi:hypothetical protein